MSRSEASEVTAGGAAGGFAPGWRLLAGVTSLIATASAVHFLLAVAVLDRPYARVLLAPILPLASGLAARLDTLGLAGQEPNAAGQLEGLRAQVRTQLRAERFRLRMGTEESGGDVEVSLVSRAGLVVSSTDPGRVGQPVRAELRAGGAPGGASRSERTASATSTGSPRVVRLDGDHYVVSSHRAAQDEGPGSLLVRLPRAALTLDAAPVLAAHGGIAVAILAGGAGLLGLGVAAARRRGGRSHGGPSSVVVMSVIVACQLATTGVLLGALAQDSLTSARASTELLLDQLARRTDGPAGYPNPTGSGWDASAFVREVLAEVPGVVRVAVVGSAGPGRPGAEVARAQASAEAGWMPAAAGSLVSLLGLEGRLEVRVPMPAPGGPDRLLVAGLSPALIPNQVLPSALDSLTVLLIVVLFSAELLIIVRHFADGAARPSAEGTGGNYVLARPAAFFYVFGIDLSMSFLPLHVERLYKPLFGLSREVVAGLPISAEFLSVGVAILVAGVWYDRRGWQQPMFVGLVLATGGALGSCLATDVTAFILSRVLVGTGYGFALMASQGYVIGRTDGRTKAQGLAHLFAGLYAGSICGGAAGGILAERYGYRMAFLLGALAIVLVIPYVVTFMRDAAGCVPSPRTLASATGGGARRLGRFLSDRSVLALMLLSSLPASIAAVGFLNYFSPLYLSRLGASETTIGKLLVIYGVCLIYLGPVMGRHADASESRRSVIFAGCLLGGAAFLAFNALDGVLAVAVAILLMGLSHSMVLSSQSAYMLELQVTRELGPGMALGIFRASSRFGQMVGPMVFSAVAMSGGMQTGVGWLGVVYVVLAVLFLLLTRERREVLVREYSQ